MVNDQIDKVYSTKVLLKYLSLCRRQNKYIYIVDDVHYYTSMEENDIVHYETTMAHTPIHKMTFKDTEFIDVLYSVFPIFKDKNICIETKLLMTIINKSDDVTKLMSVVDDGLLIIKNVRTVDSVTGYKVLGPKEKSKNQMLRDIHIGRIISGHIKSVIEDLILTQDNRFLYAQKLNVDMFNRNETCFIRFKEGDIETPDIEKGLSTAVNIPIWDGETTISIHEYVNKQTFDNEPKIIAELVILDKAVQLRLKFLSDKIDVISLHNRKWFPFR